MNRMKGFLSGRVSIWSISHNWGVIYYILFSAQTTVALCLISWQKIVTKPEDTPTETLIAIGQASAPLILTIAAETLVIVLAMEGIAMLAERYLKKRYAVGKEEGTMQERARAKARFDAWNKRRLEAESEGKPFDEPSPDFDSDDA